MGFLRLLSSLSLGLSLVIATPVIDIVSEPAPVLKRFTSRANPDVNLRFVSDSGVCETTPGVHQMSGYIDVGTNMSMVCGFI